MQRFQTNKDHNVFAHFPKDPNCDVCGMTQTTRARCKHRPLRRAVGIQPPTTLGELLTTDPQILNLDDESRNDHSNALIVQDGYSHWLQSYPMTSKDAQETASCLRRFLPPSISETRKETIQRSSPKRVRTYKGRMTRILDRGKSCSTSERQRWFKVAFPKNGGTVRMECCCYFRNVHDKMVNGRTACEKSCGVKCDGALIPFGAKVSYKPISSKDEAKLHQFGEKKDASRNLHGLCPTCGTRVVGGFAHRRLRTPQEPVSLRHTRQTVQAPRSRSGRKALVSMCRRISISSIFLNPHAAKCPPSETLSKMKKKRIGEEIGEYFWSMSGDFTNRHHEVH